MFCRYVKIEQKRVNSVMWFKISRRAEIENCGLYQKHSSDGIWWATRHMYWLFLRCPVTVVALLRCCIYYPAGRSCLKVKVKAAMPQLGR